MTILQKTAYAGWQNCLKLSNKKIEMIITLDVWPRIIRGNTAIPEKEEALLPALKPYLTKLTFPN
jgi:hypothetical protein